MRTVVRSQRQTIARVLPHPGNRRVLVHARAGLVIVPSDSPELLVNGDWATDVLGWTTFQGDAVWYSAGQAGLVNTLTDKGQIYQAVVLVPGARYRARFSLSSADGGTPVRGFIQTSGLVFVAGTPDYKGNTAGTFDVNFTAPAANMAFVFEIKSTGIGTTMGLFPSSLKRGH